MQETKEQSFEKIMDYENRIHEQNQQRIKIGIRLVIIIPLIFLTVMFKLDSNKVVFLVLWIASLFGISLYLIVVEYMDYKMQEKLKELGIKDEDADIQGLISDELVVEKVIESSGILESNIPKNIALALGTTKGEEPERTAEPRVRRVKGMSAQALSELRAKKAQESQAAPEAEAKPEAKPEPVVQKPAEPEPEPIEPEPIEPEPVIHKPVYVEESRLERVEAEPVIEPERPTARPRMSAVYQDYYEETAETPYSEDMSRAEEELVESIRKYIATLGKQAAPAIDDIQRKDAQDYAQMRRDRAASRRTKPYDEWKD